MEKEFVPYDLAVKLKALGFDEPCLDYFANSNPQNSWTISYNSDDLHRPFESVARPTFSQAFRWFREKHNLRGFIGFRPNTKQFDYHIYDMSLSGKEYVKQRTMEEFNKDPKVGTYEEAELACLIKLIEIVELKTE